MPRITRPQSLPSCRRGCAGWCVRCYPGSSSGRRSCCYGWRRRSYATNGLAVPTRDAAPPAAKAGWSRHLKPVVVVLDFLSQDERRRARRYEPALLGLGHCSTASHGTTAGGRPQSQCGGTPRRRSTVEGERSSRCYYSKLLVIELHGDCVQICQEGDRRLQERRGATRNTSGLVGSFGTIQDDEYRQRSQGQALRFTGCPGM